MKDETGLAALLEKIYRERGLDARHYKHNFLTRRLAVRLRACGVVSYEAYGACLDADPAEFDAFLATLAINVSYFFRDTSAFAALERRVLAPLLAARAREARPGVRVWCAGCAAGQEPYSVAMLLSEHLGAHLPEWHIDILGTDVDTDVLAVARRASYEEDSLRFMTPARRARYFTAAGSAPPTWQLAPEIVRLVRFRSLDLLAEEYPQHLDIILCRNVMIYFTRAQQVNLFQQFHAALQPGGALLVGRVEIPPAAARAWFEPLDFREHLYVQIAAPASVLKRGQA